MFCDISGFSGRPTTFWLTDSWYHRNFLFLTDCLATDETSMTIYILVTIIKVISLKVVLWAITPAAITELEPRESHWRARISCDAYNGFAVGICEFMHIVLSRYDNPIAAMTLDLMHQQLIPYYARYIHVIQIAWRWSNGLIFAAYYDRPKYTL
jgi:hypothetical protein